MSKGLLYKLFGVGRIPQQILTELQSELIEVSDEGVKGSVTYKNFHAPGKRENWRRIWFSGAIAVTGTRLVALQYFQLRDKRSFYGRPLPFDEYFDRTDGQTFDRL